MEGELAGGGRHDLAGEELPDRLEQFARGGPSVRGRDRLPGARDAWTAGGGLRRGTGLEQEQQVPFLLADPAPDRGQLDGPVRAGQVRLGLLHTDDSPAQRAEYLPPAQLVKGDLGPARGAVCSQQLFLAAQPGGGRGRAETPRLDAEPAEVLGRVAGVDEFPVDDGAQRVRADDEVAEPQVAVDDHRWAGWRRVRLQRAQGQLKDRAGLVIGGELGPQAGQRVRRGQIPGDLEPVQAGGELADLAHQYAARPAVGGVAQDAAGDRLASDAAHDQASRAPQIGAVGAEQYLRHGEPGRPGRFDDPGFPAHPPRLVRPPGGSRRSTSSVRDPPVPTASNDQVSREAPPDSRARPSMAAMPRASRSASARACSAINLWSRPWARAGACTRTCTRQPGASVSPRCLR